MYTKGTYTDTSKGSYEPNYVLAIKKDGDNYGICFFDISTFKCYLGSFVDDSCQSILRTTLTQVRPVEVVIEKNGLTMGVEKMLRNAPIVPVFNFFNHDKCYSRTKTLTALDKYLLGNKMNND